MINPATFLWGVDSPNHLTTIRSGGRLNMQPQHIVRGGNEDAYHGRIKMETSSTLNVDLGAVSRWTLAGNLEMGLGSTVLGDDIRNLGEVRGHGTIGVEHFENAGRVAPGRMFGGLKMPSADYIQTPAGILEISLGESLIGNGSSLLQTDTAQLAGTLALSWASSFNPAPGTEFDFLTANSVSGMFSNVSITSPFGNLVTGEVVYHPNRVSFRITTSPGASQLVTADFNDDGVVDGADLIVWQKATAGKGELADRLAADATGDGLVDGADFLAWQRELGRRAANGGPTLPGRTLGISAVPEPSTWLLGLLAAAAGVLPCRKRV
jgi:hypothetical protein